MKAFDISLSHAGEISSLVNIANRYPYTILLRQGRYAVDAKSLLGICSLHQQSPIRLEAYADDCDALQADLRHLIC